MSDGLTKADMAMLERAFTAEIEGRKFQTKSKRAKSLADRGYLMWTECDFPGVGGMMRVEWFDLTHAGRIAYCDSCRGVGDV